MASISPALSISPEGLLETSLGAGATEAEVYWSSSHTKQVTFEGNRLTQVDNLESQGIALRVWQEGRCGLAVACGPVAPELLVSKALALSQIGQPGTIKPSNQSPISWELDPLELDIDSLVEIGRSGIAQVLEIQPDAICNSELSWETDRVGLLNSQGMECQFEDFSVSGYLGVEWVRGDDFLDVDAGQSISPRPGQTLQSLEVDRWVRAIKRRLQWSENTIEVSGDRYAVILLPTAAELLLDSATAALDGRQLLRRASPWHDKQGERVVTPLLSLSQRPRFGPFGVPFDDEGTCTKDVDFVRDGVLQQGFCDRRFAHMLQVSPTGNGFRPGLNNYPEPGLVNLVLPEPSVSFSQLLARMDRGLLIERVMGSFGELSGEFSVSVELGYWVEGGEIAGRVKDVMLAGNGYEALNAIHLLGASPDDLTQDGRDWAGGYCVPLMLVNEMSAISRD